MKVNAQTAISTPSILLVPYTAHHVPIYHAWMQSPSLRAATASELLTLDEEYAMQRSWREDRDKLTFIICLPNSGKEEMVGDINLFLFPSDDDDDDDDGDATAATGSESEQKVIGELELMIAEPQHRRKGHGRAALLTFLDYIFSHWPEIYGEYSGSPGEGSTSSLRYLRVKIQDENVGSIKLFESVGFVGTGQGANYFGEVELRWKVENRVSRSESDGAAVCLPYVDSEVK